MFTNQLSQKWIVTAWLVLSAVFSYAQVTATITPKTATCFSNGELTLSNFAGGVAPYEAVVKSGPGVLPNKPYRPLDANGSINFPALQKGTFEISVLDGNGNETIITTTLAGTYESINFGLSATVGPCINGSPGKGSISVTGLTGGTEPFMYAILIPNGNRSEERRVGKEC